MMGDRNGMEIKQLRQPFQQGATTTLLQCITHHSSHHYHWGYRFSQPPVAELHRRETDAYTAVIY